MKQYWHLLLLVLPILLVGATPKDATPTIKSPGAEALNRFIGTWQTEYKLEKATWTPEEKNLTADLVYTRILGGKFIQEKSVQSDKTEGMVMYTYDLTKKHYRMWHFSSQGHTSESVGHWEEENNTITWYNSDDQFKTRSIHRFVDDDTFEWDVRIMRRNIAEVMFRAKGTAKKVKKLKK